MENGMQNDVPYDIDLPDISLVSSAMLNSHITYINDKLFMRELFDR